MKKIELIIYNEKYAISKLDTISKLIDLETDNGFINLSISGDEISLICKEELIPDTEISENGFKLIKIKGILDFSLIGILSTVSGILAQNKISILAVSTYLTDYFLIRDYDLPKALDAFEKNAISYKYA